MSVSVPDRPSPDFTDPEQRFTLSFEEAIEIVRAIDRGEVDAFVTRGHEGSRVSFVDTSISTYAILVEQAHDALFVLDDHGRVISHSGRLAALVGMTPEALLGCAFEDLVAPDSLPRFHRFVENSLSGGAHEEIHVRPRDGRPD
ncbi:MAG TPA: PAS domain S-box protein, partial [Planctomycetota bacterium]|nr:PAS domain S-box protein [Planctomycetota bacterium]